MVCQMLKQKFAKEKYKNISGAHLSQCMGATRSIANILEDIIQEIIANWQKIDHEFN